MPQSNSDKLDSMRHSLAHLLASAILEMFPGSEARNRARD